LNRDRAFVFIGGLTQFSDKISELESTIEEYAVYAGKLERYNGVDRLVRAWTEQKICRYLHVFGKGCLEGFLREQSINNKYIVFHGQRDESEVITWQSRARWNLRYSDGINQDYFFPSKFFNICAADGLIIVNDFNGIPFELRETIAFVDDELSELSEIVGESHKIDASEASRQRRRILEKNHTWRSCINRIIERFLLSAS
jgi:hypothetical protein